jgi:hypothetical protein
MGEGWKCRISRGMAGSSVRLMPVFNTMYTTSALSMEDGRHCLRTIPTLLDDVVPKKQGFRDRSSSSQEIIYNPSRVPKS